MNEQDEQLENYTRYVLWNTAQDDDGIITDSVGEYVKIGSKEMRLTRYQTRRKQVLTSPGVQVGHGGLFHWRSALSRPSMVTPNPFILYRARASSLCLLLCR